MDIFVCIGSSCHLKGSYAVIGKIKEFIAAHQLDDKVNLSASFCLGKCTDGVTIKVDEDIITGITVDIVDSVLCEKFKEAGIKI